MYLSGDFVTPEMLFAWQQGVPYMQVGPCGIRAFPEGTPYGGPDAKANRERFVPMLIEDLQQLPKTIPANAWDEASNASPGFHRVNPKSYEALLSETNTRNATSPIG